MGPCGIRQDQASGISLGYLPTHPTTYRFSDGMTGDTRVKKVSGTPVQFRVSGSGHLYTIPILFIFILL
jgi:hypothetical protein